MLKKKKTTASGEPVLVEKRSQNAQPQNEILCSKGAWGRCPRQQQAERKIMEGFCTLRVGVY